MSVPEVVAGRASALARRLYEAARERRTIEPLSAEHPDLGVAEAYAIQDALVDLHLADGARLVGAKLGLTSRAKQLEMNVHEPIAGWLTDRMVLEPGEPLVVGELAQPRAEPEIAFLLGRDLAGPAVTAVHVLAATEAVFGAIEVLDSRYAGYRFTLPDVVADNASSGRFVLGGAIRRAGLDLAEVGCVFEQNGRLVATAAGAAVMGHPARAVAWLVRRLAAEGRSLRAGDIVLSGGLTAALPITAGDVVTATFGRLGTVTLACR
ncbi:MAG TPA: fumarylacetoacetate hydrolase family protein [Candidatus Binatia bacterium]|nr:fumarylacetoacetate hydrolase family protein [Candidatus Binatia bacterium]